MNPEDRCRFAVETARAVLDGRLDPNEGAVAVTMQAMQITPLLRADRDSVTRSECESIATRLRMLAEQVSDRGNQRREPDAYVAIAESIGVMAQALR